MVQGYGGGALPSVRRSLCLKIVRFPLIAYQVSPVAAQVRTGPVKSNKRSHVLGIITLAAVQQDIARVELPSWVRSGPKSFGTVKHGKLSADEWRSMCVVHLPTTLIRLWGHEVGRPKKMLDNFMDLVGLVELGGMLRCSEAQIKLYEQLVLRYLKAIKDLYKESTIKPNHHIAYHIGEFMRKFGPVHSWRAFAFERFNYLLQNLSTNMHFGMFPSRFQFSFASVGTGAMEMTFMSKTCRAANLRPLLQDATIQQAIEEVISVYSSISNEDPRGTRVRDAFDWIKTVSTAGIPTKSEKRAKLDGISYANLLRLLNAEAGYPLYVDPHSLERSNTQHFLETEILSCVRIQIGGVMFKPDYSSLKDCNTVYRLHEDIPQTNLAGRIRQIFLHQRLNMEGRLVEETFIAIQPLSPLTTADAASDPYRNYELGGGFLCYDNYINRIDIIRPSSVISHFAKTVVEIGKISQPCVHVLPLDHVGHTLLDPLFHILVFSFLSYKLLKLVTPKPLGDETEEAE